MWIWPAWRRAARKSAVSPKSQRLGEIWWEEKEGRTFAGLNSTVLIYMFRFH